MSLFHVFKTDADVNAKLKMSVIKEKCFFFLKISNLPSPRSALPNTCLKNLDAEDD